MRVLRLFFCVMNSRSAGPALRVCSMLRLCVRLGSATAHAPARPRDASARPEHSIQETSAWSACRTAILPVPLLRGRVNVASDLRGCTSDGEAAEHQENVVPVCRPDEQRGQGQQYRPRDLDPDAARRYRSGTDYSSHPPTLSRHPQPHRVPIVASQFSYESKLFHTPACRENVLLTRSPRVYVISCGVPLVLDAAPGTRLATPLQHPTWHGGG